MYSTPEGSQVSPAAVAELVRIVYELARRSNSDTTTSDVHASEMENGQSRASLERAVAEIIQTAVDSGSRPNEKTRNASPFDVKDPHWTFERALAAAVERAKQEGIGPVSPHVSLSWRHLFLFGDDAGTVTQKDAWSIFTDIGELIGRVWRKQPEKTILHGIDGLLSPGEMLLVLGAPGSVCTSLLKALVGQFEGYRRWNGAINYSGISADVMLARFRSMLVFNDENDYHLPRLTVGQTLEFVARTKTPSHRINGVSKEQYIRRMCDIIAVAFGLKHTLNTRVGNDFIAGVSGGERRRVSVAEMVCASSRAHLCGSVLTLS